MSQVVVDDTDPNIQYSGPWFTVQNSMLNAGTHGSPFQHTLHGVTVNASFSYSFSGSQVVVLGTSMTTNVSGSQDPTWECFVDNVSIGWSLSAEVDTVENNWNLCQSDLQDGPHVLSVNVAVLFLQTFWFDQIEYTPSTNVSLDNSTVRFDSSDPSVQYSSGWTAFDGFVNLTQTVGSTVTFEFFGVSVFWLGFVPSNFSLTPSSANYSIDGQTPITFTVPSLSNAINSNTPLYNQILFQTETLSRGQHKLIVTYQDNSSASAIRTAPAAPLALDAFVVQNATSSAATSTATSAFTSFPTVPWSSSPNSTSNMVSMNNGRLICIIIGVVGGVIVLVLLLFLYIYRRRSRRAQTRKSNPEAFTLPPQVRSCTSQPFSSKFSENKEPTDVVPANSFLSPPPGARTNLINPAIRNTVTMPLMQPLASTSAQGGNLGFLQHEDSGARMPQHVRGNLVELPPAYTIG